MAFQVFKMGFRSILAQTVSILRVKFWKVFKTGKRQGFFILGTSSHNVPFLCLWHFFLTKWLSNKLSFSVPYVLIRCFGWSIFPHDYHNAYGPQYFLEWLHATFSEELSPKNIYDITTEKLCWFTWQLKYISLPAEDLWIPQ